MLNSRLCAVSVGIVCLIGAIANPCAAAPAEQKPAAAPKAPAGGPGQSAPAGAAGITPQAVPTPDAAATAAAGKEAASACKKTVAEIASDGPAALKSLTPEKRDALLQGNAATDLFMCLAIADGNASYCEALPDPGRTQCAGRLQLATELKEVPKEAFKAHLIYRSCVENSAKADCGKVRDAMVGRTGANCEGLSNASLRDFCTALASGDAAKCKGISDRAERAHCEAYASDDPSRCPSDSKDCKNLAGAFAAVKKQGLDGVGDIDPAMVAVSKGKQACTPLQVGLEKSCAEAR
jgi:hypothetical protein